MTTDAHARQARPTTDVDRIANEYLDALVELSPITATYLGIAGHDEDLDDFSPSHTRCWVIRALRALRNKRETLPPKKHGNIPL